MAARPPALALALLVRLVGLVGLVMACATACADARDQVAARTVTVRGSDTMIILAQRWAEGFMAEHPDIAVQVSGGGSGTGITGLITGTTDLATASRPIEAHERALLVEQRGVEAVEIPVAIDAVAIYVHRDNPISSLSLAELEGLFRGHVRDWSELGVELGAVTLYSRENNSGTYAYFKHEVLREFDFAVEAQTLPGTAAVINAVSKDPRAIGYGGLGYAIGVRVVPLRLADGRVIAAAGESLLDYPLARPLFIYSAGQPSDEQASLIDYIRSSAGQTRLRELGFFPLPEPPLPGRDEAHG